MGIFGINAGEFVILAVLAVVFFGPERIPEVSRKAARIVHYLRNIANDATSQLKQELGPEYSDLTVADLNPKTFVKKHLLDDIQDELSGVKSDLDDVKSELNLTGAAAIAAANAATTGASAASGTSAKKTAATATVDPAITRMKDEYGLCFDMDAT